MSHVEISQDNFHRVKQELEKGQNLFVTGVAGSGKSHLLRQLKAFYRKDLSLTATTGISALNINGSTIHSWARLGIGAYPEEKIYKILLKDKKAFSRIIACKYLAIDEISMLSDKMLYLLHRVLCLVRRNQRPFGGIQVILFGDFLQLPPVLRDDEQICLKGQLWEVANIKTILLTTNFRQKDDTSYYNLLKDVRKGNNLEACCNILHQRVGEKYPQDITKLVATREKAREINQERLKSLETDSKIFTGKYTGTEIDINLHKSPFIELETIELKKDAKVMLIYNVNLKEGLVNGLLGKISRFSQNGYPIVDFENGDLVEVKEISWEVEDSKGKVIFSFTQLPLQLAWATTIHKSQGCTFSALHVDLSRCFAPGQAYVALSRVRSLDGLFLEPFSSNKIVTDREMVAYYDSLEKS